MSSFSIITKVFQTVNHTALPVQKLRLLIWTGLCVGLYHPVLASWLQFSANNQLFSYLPLIPFVAAFMMLTNKHQPADSNRRLTLWIRGLGGILLLLGLGMGLKLYMSPGMAEPNHDMTCAGMLGLYLVYVGGILLGASPEALSTWRFPLIFMMFIIPLPSSWIHVMETGLQYGSAQVAYYMLRWSGMPTLLDGTILKLPGFTMEVGPQCSGIRSSWILLISSFVAADWFLKFKSHQLLIILFVIPLGFLRNGFRVWSLGQLCVQIDPSMIDSPIHHKGGPLFFVLSLIPLLALALWLRRREVSKTKTKFKK